MTKPLLIWQSDIFPDKEREIASKYFSIEEYDGISKYFPNEIGGPFAMRGAVATATRLGLNIDRFNCQKWVPWLSEHMISKNFWWDIPERIQNISSVVWPIFIRPDSCKKLFAGQVYTYGKWAEEFNFLKQRNGEKILAFCANSEWIGREWRCLFVGQELVGISDYMYEGEILDNPARTNITEGLKSLARQIRNNDYFSPEDNVTIDIGQREDGSYGLVEINFLETSGWYACDPEPVYASLAKQF